MFDLHKNSDQCCLILIIHTLSTLLHPISNSHIKGSLVSFIAVFGVVLATSPGFVCTYLCVCVRLALMGADFTPLSTMCCC